MADCLSQVILSEGHHPRSASFLDHVQTDAVYFGDGQRFRLAVKQKQLKLGGITWKGVQKSNIKFPNGVLQLARGSQGQKGVCYLTNRRVNAGVFVSFKWQE